MKTSSLTTILSNLSIACSSPQYNSSHLPSAQPFATLPPRSSPHTNPLAPDDTLYLPTTKPQRAIVLTHLANGRISPIAADSYLRNLYQEEQEAIAYAYAKKMYGLRTFSHQRPDTLTATLHQRYCLEQKKSLPTPFPSLHKRLRELEDELSLNQQLYPEFQEIPTDKLEPYGEYTIYAKSLTHMLNDIITDMKWPYCFDDPHIFVYDLTHDAYQGAQQRLLMQIEKEDGQ